MKAHRTDGVSLVFALIFLAIAGWWLVAQLLDLALPAVGWFLAGALILLGVLGLLGALRSGRSTPRPGPAPSGDFGAGPAGPLDATRPDDARYDDTEYDDTRYEELATGPTSDGAPEPGTAELSAPRTADLSEPNAGPAPGTGGDPAAADREDKPSS